MLVISMVLRPLWHYYHRSSSIHSQWLLSRGNQDWAYTGKPLMKRLLYPGPMWLRQPQQKVVLKMLVSLNAMSIYLINMGGQWLILYLL